MVWHAWRRIALAALLAATFVLTDHADARSRRSRAKAIKHVKVERYSPPTSAIVVDANTGAVLHSENGDSPRHPASLTKIMTLYLLFERLEAGKITLNTELPVSAHAAAQAPSKLGLKPGETISVESAIKAIVTKSANDVAVVIAEALGGNEEAFARMMTRKARASACGTPSITMPRACRTTSRSPRRAIRPCSAARSRTTSRSTTAISPPRASRSAASAFAVTTVCSAESRASTASRPATPMPPASIS